MNSKDDMSGCKPLPSSKPVEKTKYVGYKWGTGDENIDTCAYTERKKKDY